MNLLFDEYRSKQERLRLTVQQFRGAPRVDLRVWYSDKNGEMKPGRIGFTIPRHAVASLMSALGEAASAAEVNEAAHSPD
jgi:hypothetical protein